MSGEKEKMIAYCGIVCTNCDGYIITKAGDEKKAMEMVEKASQTLGKELTLNDFWCDGCLVEGKKCAYCHECAIRKCAIGKGIANCAYCPDYRCETLSAFLANAGTAGETLDDIRRGL
jgi:hypothetical protein